MDLNLLVAFSAVVGVLIAVIALLQQSRDTHLSLGVEILRDMVKQFDSQGTRHCRVVLAKEYLKVKPGKAMSSSVFGDTSSLFDFFEEVAVLYRRKILDKELVWESFCYKFTRWWEVAEGDIRAARAAEQDNSYWEECEFMYKQLIKFDSKHRKIKPQRFSRNELLRFLMEESRLEEISLIE